MTLRRPIFVGGAPRSGTTLLRVILDQHSSIACGPEMRAIPNLAQLSASTRQSMGAIYAAQYGLAPSDLNAVFRELISAFLEPYAARRRKPRIAEKTPANALHFEELARLFPDASFVQIIRDGRDVASSLLGVDWIDGRTGAPFAYTKDPRAGALLWVEHIRSGRRAAAAGARYFEIRYEDLARAPEAALRPLFGFLEEPWEAAVLDYRKNATISAGQNETSATAVAQPLTVASIGRWKHDLGGRAEAAFAGGPAELLRELGYE